jgi:hypothetical protein
MSKQLNEHLLTLRIQFRNPIEMREGSFPLTGDSYNIMCYVREKNSIGNIFKINNFNYKIVN